MNYLAIETSSDICSVSSCLGGKTKTLDNRNVKEHSEYMPIFCERLLEGKLDSLDFIALSIGPGSYAGLKTSCSFAKGLSLAVNRPILPVETFRGMNLSIKNEGRYFIALYSHRDYAFFQLYNSQGPIGESICDKIDNMKKHSIYGYGFNNFNAEIEYSEIMPSSKNIGMIAAENFNNLSGKNINNISPILLSAERK